MKRFTAFLLVLSTAATSAPAGGADPEAGAESAGTRTVRPPRVDLGALRFAEGRWTAPIVGSADHAELTLDPDLQRDAGRLIARANPLAAAIVAVETKTGKILIWQERRGKGAASPLLDSTHPSASVFKLVTTAALLERGVEPSRSVCYFGATTGIERRHLDPPRNGRVQCDTFAHALGHSRNAVYAQLVTRNLARQDLLTVAERLGFNGDAPFDVPVRVGKLSVPYEDLAFARTAAGFLGATLSPVGGAHLAYTIAMGGVSHRLHIVERAGEYSAPRVADADERLLESLTAHRLARMMEVTVHSGTAREAFSADERPVFPGYRVAGKTGTLQLRPGDPTTTWFVGFAPSRNPEIVLSVLVQNGSVWRQKAHTLAREVLRAYRARRGAPGVSHPLDR